MKYRLIKDLYLKEYKVGDFIPMKLGIRLENMHKIGHCQYPHVERVETDEQGIIQGVILDKPEPIIDEPKDKPEQKSPLDINKDGKVDLKDAKEVLKRTFNRKKKR